MPPPPLHQSLRPLPEPLAALSTLALDLHWAWNHAGDVVWQRLDEALWEHTRNPWLILQHVPRARLDELAGDATFLRDLAALVRARERYRASPQWRPDPATRLPVVAYFSMEFGLDEALPLYAGGLGVLAGDYLKTASDLHAPVLGIGILWQQGYFRQVLDPAGRQTELYPFNEPASLPVQPVIGPAGDALRVAIAFPGRTILLRAWQATVGRTMLYLLDANDPLNAPADRGLTSTLYGGGTEVRLLQEIILGVGGWRLAEALRLGVEICHLNEGHAALVIVERARRFMEQHGTTFRQAMWATRAGNVFTTHTAVPAGFDAYPLADLMHYRSYFEAYVRDLGISWTDLLALGRQHPDDPDEPFNMAWLAMRGCSWVNGVSRLHGAVSRRLFSGLFPNWPEHEVPVTHVTNGVHVPSWDSPWTDAVWTRAAGKERWRGDVSALADGILSLSDEALWSLRASERADLVRYARERLRRKLARHSSLEEAAQTASHVLDPDALTLGFARRFATYKRPNLLLSDPARLRRLLSSGRPVQLIVAGKAHPRDEEGKTLIQEWARFAASDEVRRRVVFLDDYDMRLATELVQGVDVWLNTPRRPWEASGTSGMKVLVNGGLNLSTLDGWWAEAFDPACGWAIGDRLERPDDDRRDALDLYAVLENEIVPAFYDRDATGRPRRWLARMRASMAHLTPRFSSARMLQEYLEQAYVPAAAQLRRRAAGECALARNLDGWAGSLTRGWSTIRFGDVTVQTTDRHHTFTATVHLGEVDGGSIQVELYADPVDEAGPFLQGMAPAELVPGADKAFRYRTTVLATRPPEHFTVRVRPYHADARVPLECPLITWQR
jgi:starch phosphorylase